MDGNVRAALVTMGVLENIEEELQKKAGEYAALAKDESSSAGDRLCNISRASGIGDALDVIINWHKVLMEDAKKRTNESGVKAS